ncbi:MAG: RNA polymerase sigma factor [Gemmatimonadaceae bacterium]|nr:RNA polymerase sigma factor [Gemmatimonadaceae bacterium]
MTESDASLVARARLGETAALETLLRRYFRAAYLVALARVGNRADAEDVCQDAFVRCVERMQDCRNPDSFGAWLIEIVRNTAHNRGDYLRVRATEPIASHLELQSGMRTDAAVERHELRDQLVCALARLTSSQREVVLLHDLEGWRHAEIAVHLDLSVSMSRRHLSDGRKKLRELLGDYATLEPDHD